MSKRKMEYSDLRTIEDLRNVRADVRSFTSATKTRNYAIGDPVLDWFSMMGPSSSSKHLQVLFNKGHRFEEKIIELIRSECAPGHFVDIQATVGDSHHTAFIATIQAMLDEIPLIYQGTLINYDTQTYGKPDLLVRSDWLRVLSQTPVVTPEEEALKRYCIVDIKNTTLPMAADGKHITNGGSVSAFKAQMYVYANALGKIGRIHDVPIGFGDRAFILGRRWKQDSSGDRSNSAFNKLGVIDFEGYDSSYPDTTRRAIAWYTRCQRDKMIFKKLIDEGAYGSLIPEMLPNMSNEDDAPWSKQKKQLADKLKDITMIWQCGTRVRTASRKDGVMSWMDPRFTSKYAVSKSFAENIDNILRVNRDVDDCGKIKSPLLLNEKVLFPDEVNDDDYVKVFVDFEMVNDALTDDMSKLPETSGVECVFMIGTRTSTSTTESKCFVAPSLTEEGELEMLLKFCEYLESLCSGGKKLVMIHWGRAETTQWQKLVERHQHVPEFAEKTVEMDMSWFDMNRFLIDAKFAVTGAFGYSLKEIGKALYKIGGIMTTWDETSSTTNGFAAMSDAVEGYSRTSSREDVEKVLVDIAKYNKVDVDVMAEIFDLIKDML